jgi:hypothetical protein
VEVLKRHGVSEGKVRSGQILPLLQTILCSATPSHLFFQIQHH